MNRKPEPSVALVPGDEAAPEEFLAAMLEGLALAIADGSAPALHRAVESFARAALLAGTRPEPRLLLALCYARLGDGRRAIDHFGACLELGFGANDYPELTYEYDTPDNETLVVKIDLGQVLLWRAGCYLSLDRLEPARRDLVRVSDSTDSDIRAGVAVLWAEIRLAEDDLEAAQKQLSYALGLDPRHPDAHFLRGRLHEHRGRLDKAVAAYSRAIRLDAEAPEFRIARARARLDGGDRRRVEADLLAAEAVLAQQLPQPALVAQIAALRRKLT